MDIYYRGIKNFVCSCIESLTQVSTISGGRMGTESWERCFCALPWTDPFVLVKARRLLGDIDFWIRAFNSLSSASVKLKSWKVRRWLESSSMFSWRSEDNFESVAWLSWEKGENWANSELLSSDILSSDILLVHGSKITWSLPGKVFFSSSGKYSNKPISCTATLNLSSKAVPSSRQQEQKKSDIWK